MSKERERLISEYSDVCEKMRAIQKEWGGEWTKEFKKLRKKAKSLEKNLHELNSMPNSDSS